jgi:chloramphenicol-sensitive protein RarD
MNKGVLSAAAAYFMWGVFPIYFKIIQIVPAIQILGHRIIWSFIFVMFVLLWKREIKTWMAAINRRIILIYVAAAILLAVNWLVYVWSVNSGYVVEASLGYFINPLVSVLMGVLFLREKLRPLQWAPVAIAAVGVLFLSVTYGSLPWISLTLAFSFGTYGLVKKMAPLDSLYGLSLETAILFLPAMGYLIFVDRQGGGAFIHDGALISILLAMTGVISAIPLLLFAIGLRSAPLSTIGLLQYITPTMQFLVGILIYGETFTFTRLVGFSIVWAALIFFTIESLMAQRKGISGLPPSTINVIE